MGGGSREGEHTLQGVPEPVLAPDASAAMKCPNRLRMSHRDAPAFLSLWTGFRLADSSRAWLALFKIPIDGSMKALCSAAMAACSLWFGAAPGLLAQSFTFTTIAGSPGLAGANDGTNGAARFDRPSGLAVDAATNIYLSDTSNDTIRKISPLGTNWVVTTIAGIAGIQGAQDGTNGVATLNRPNGITVDSHGNLFVVDHYNFTIRKIAPVGTNWVVSTIAGLAGAGGSADGTNSDARFRSPVGITIDAADNLYVADTVNCTIRMIAFVGTNAVTTTMVGAPGNFGFLDGVGASAELDYPYDLTLGLSNDVYIADWGNNAIRRITPFHTNQWGLTTIAGNSGAIGSADGPGAQAEFYFPNGIVADAAGNLYVTDQDNDTIRKLTPEGAGWVVSTIGGVPKVPGSADGTGANALFNRPWGIAVGPGGILYIADFANDTVRMGVPAPPAGPPLRVSLNGNHVVLSWPASAAGFVVQETSSLSSSPTWNSVTNGWVAAGDQLFLTNAIEGASMFYRLKKQ